VTAQFSVFFIVYRYHYSRNHKHVGSKRSHARNVTNGGTVIEMVALMVDGVVVMVVVMVVGLGLGATAGHETVAWLIRVDEHTKLGNKDKANS